MKGTYERYRIDHAVWSFGSAVEYELNSVTEEDPKKARRERERIFEAWIPEAAKPAEKKYADPGSLGK